jgi:hypothetical protein
VSIVSRNYRTWAALAVACLAVVTTDAGAANLLIKRADGSTATPIPLTTSNGCTVVADGDIEVRPQAASGASNDGWCPEGAVQTPLTVAVQVSPTSINSGGSVSLTWQTTGAVSCNGAATLNGVGTTVTGWTGSRPLNQGAPGLSVSLTNGTQEAQNYVFMLTCSAASGSPVTASSQTVTVNAGDIPPPGCSNVPPSFGLTRQSTMFNTGFMQGNGEWPNGPLAVTSYNVIANVPFPSRQGNATMAVKNGQFIALEFNTGTVSIASYGAMPGNPGLPNRSGALNVGLSGEYPGLHLMAISTCPGDFTHLPDNNSEWCRSASPSATLNWTVSNVGNFTCKLQENTKYYLNIAFVDFFGGGSTCVGEPVTGSNPTACRWFAEAR